MITVSLIVWILAGLAALLLLVEGAGLPAAVVLACLVLYPVAAGVALRLSAKGLRLRLEGTAICMKGTAPVLHLELSGAGRLPVPQVKATLVAKNLLTGEESRTVVRLSSDEGSLGLPLDLSSEYCGCLQVSVEKARALDLFGIVGCQLETGETRFVTVFPQPIARDVRVLPSMGQNLDSVVYSPARKGTDATEVFALREYVEGDSLRTVHWKLSAKTGTLTVKEPSLPIDDKVLLFWDHYAQPAVLPEEADAMACVVCSLAQALMNEGRGLTFGFYQESAHSVVLTMVDDEAALHMALSQAMRQPQAAAHLGIAQLAKTSHTPFGQVIYVGCQTPDLRLLDAQASVLALVCAGADYVKAGEALVEVGFTAQSADEALKVVSVL